MQTATVGIYMCSDASGTACSQQSPAAHFRLKISDCQVKEWPRSTVVFRACQGKLLTHSKTSVLKGFNTIKESGNEAMYITRTFQTQSKPQFNYIISILFYVLLHFLFTIGNYQMNIEWKCMNSIYSIHLPITLSIVYWPKAVDRGY